MHKAHVIDCFATETALAGAIPTEIRQLTQLTTLILRDSQLTGACPQTYS